MQIKSNSKVTESDVRIDSTFINYYIKDFSDTIWFTADSEVIKCDYSKKMDKSHNLCVHNSFNKPMNGFYTIYAHRNGMIDVYKGTLKNGFFINGTFTRFYKDGALNLTGQYQNNWKIGYWTTYYSNGFLFAIFKFIEGADDPVVTIEFDNDGTIINTIDEEDEILKLMNER